MNILLSAAILIVAAIIWSFVETINTEPNDLFMWFPTPVWILFIPALWPVIGILWLLTDWAVYTYLRRCGMKRGLVHISNRNRLISIGILCLLVPLLILLWMNG